MKTTILLLLSFLSSGFALNAAITSLEYDVFVAGGKVGTHSVSIDSAAEQCIISLDTRMRFPLRKVHSRIKVRYHSGKLQFASSENRINDKLKEWSTISRQGSAYRVDVPGKTFAIQTPIQFSVGRLYAFPPQACTVVYSERWSTFVSIQASGKDTYIMHQPDGHTNVFRYTNGVCSEMETEMMAARVVFRLREL